MHMNFIIPITCSAPYPLHWDEINYHMVELYITLSSMHPQCTTP